MSALIFDIETVGEKFDELDEVTQGVLTRWTKKTSKTAKEYESAVEDLKNELGFSPLTGEIVAVGVLDEEKNTGAVYYQNLSDDTTAVEEDGIKYRPMSEKETLEQFWSLCERYQEFVSFNGRCFDVPFLAIRSAIHGVRPCKDLMSNRYLTSQKFGAKHIDLFDQLTFYGVMQKKSSLHLWARAFGIKSPKADGVSGDEVAGLFRAGEYLKIARYNAGDLRATKELYERWKKYLKF